MYSCACCSTFIVEASFSELTGSMAGQAPGATSTQRGLPSSLLVVEQRLERPEGLLADFRDGYTDPWHSLKEEDNVLAQADHLKSSSPTRGPRYGASRVVRLSPRPAH